MSKITDWQPVISNPAFWANYYVSHIDFQKEEDDFEVLEALFGCDMDNVVIARRELTKAWTDLGLLPHNAIMALVERITWVGETSGVDGHSIPIQWHYDDDLGWVTNACHSYRNPDNRWEAMDFKRWNTFLALVMRNARKS